MDPLADVFTAMRVESAGYKRLELSAPWGISFIAFQHAKFGLVLRGSCWLKVQDVPQPVRLAQGDCYLLPRGNAFSLSDAPDTPLRRFGEILSEQQGHVIRYGGGGARTVLVGGRFVFGGPGDRPLTDLLPPLIHIGAAQARKLALQTTLRYLAAETMEPTLGSRLVIDRLADILFVHAIRVHLNGGAERRGWLGALADPQIGAALRLMHEQAERAWTLEALAEAIGMSRSAFALRFKQLVGESPMEYLTRWRIYKASRLLRENDNKLIDVANSVGYDSDGAFHKAFKRVLGMTPGEYRRGRLHTS